MSVPFELNGAAVEVSDDRSSLLDALRGELGVRSTKDGCSPQGQCGCCTVLVDGAPRVACVTPVGRVRGRAVTTIDGLADGDRWGAAFCATGASQCGFCTPGIIMRLAAIDRAALSDRAVVDKALLAHLCRCTGWQPVREACALLAGVDDPLDGCAVPEPTPERLEAATRRATLEGGVEQTVDPTVALGLGGFADDRAPADALVALRDGSGTWTVADTVAEARRVAAVTQGRRTTAPPVWPVELPSGEWAVAFRTTWVEPAYLEPDAAWCVPGGEPASPLGNGGAFGGKSRSEVGEVARRLADEHGRAVRVVMTREDTVRSGPKRPPLAVGVDATGSGVARLARPSDPADEAVLRERIGHVAPDVVVEFVDVVGPPVSAAVRGAGWAEVAAAVASATGADGVVAPSGAAASATIAADGAVHVRVSCGDPLDEVVLRSYVIGATHMALGMVRSESISLDDSGAPIDLTIRSFGVLRAVDTPPVHVRIDRSTARPVPGAEAVFAAVLAAAWRHAGCPALLPSAP